MTSVTALKPCSIYDSKVGTLRAIGTSRFVVTAALGAAIWIKDFIMHNRNFPYGLVLAGALVVLFSLMYVTSVAVTHAPTGL